MNNELENVIDCVTFSKDHKDRNWRSNPNMVKSHNRYMEFLNSLPKCGGDSRPKVITEKPEDDYYEFSCLDPNNKIQICRKEVTFQPNYVKNILVEEDFPQIIKREIEITEKLILDIQ